jgi:glutamate carboxypeptidase
MAGTAAPKLLTFLRSRRGEMNDLLRRLAEAESPSLQPERQHEMFALLAAELRESEYVVRRIRGHGTGDHLYAVPRRRSRSAPYQLLLGHMDTVWPVGTLQTMPVHQEDGLLFGPGVADMKGGLVEIVFALRALRELGLEPSVTPVVFVNSDEEIGSDDSTCLIRLLAKGADRAFVLESGEGPRGKLKIARKGVSRFVITVRGRPAHAGADPERGISAILELSHQVQRLFALNDPSRGVTVNVGTIDGGLRPNVVAPTATAVVDVRTPTAAQLRRVERAIRELEPVLPGAQLEIAGGDGRPPMEPFPRNRALLASAMSLGEEVDLRIEDAGLVGGGSDANTTSMFTATVDGLGPVAAGSHAVDEQLDLTTLPERTALLALLLLEAPTREHHRVPARRNGGAVHVQPRGAVRVALLGTDWSTTNPELVDAWRNLGIEIALLGPEEAREWVDPGDVVLGRLDVLPSVDGVQPGLISLLMLERRGLRVLNPAPALVRAHDKLLTARVLLKAGIPHPQSERLLPGRKLLSVRPPCVIKPRFGSWGTDVTRCDTPDELERHLEQLQDKPWFLRRGAVAQELVPPVGFDLRLLVAGDAVVGAINRVAAPGEWRTNVSLGGSRKPTVPSPEACTLGVAAAKAIGADLVGVDLLPIEGGYTVVELNGAVDFHRDYSLPGEDVYEQAARMLRLVPGSG